MGLLEVGRPTRDYTNNRKKIACKLYEGGLTYHPNGIDATGKTSPVHTLESPLQLHQLVELHEDSTARHIVVKAADEGSEKIVGKVLFDPDLTWTPDGTYQSKNRLPKKDCEWGEFSPRSATIEFFGKAVDEVAIVEENEAIAPYDNLEYVGFVDGKDTFKKSSGTTNLLALGGVKALESGVGVVLEGYEFYGATKE